MKGISVVICCFNSADRIRDTLSFIVMQEAHNLFAWEVIVVNNASSDNTKEIIQKFIHDYSVISLQLIDEPIPGLTHARKRGIENAKFDLIVFCDDDNHLDSHYLKNAFQLMNDKPEVAIAGGWCKPKFPFFPGKWIEPNYAALAVEKEPKISSYVEWVFGAGMIIRKEIFLELQKKSMKIILTGRIGRKQTSGEDAELCHLVRFLGYKVYYSSDLILEHSISSNRLTKWSFIKANYKNVFMVVYFFLLDKIIKYPTVHSKKLFNEFLQTRIKYSMYYLPRIFIGKNSFFSFMMFFQNVQLIGWLLMRRKQFADTCYLIKDNLSIHDGRK